MFLPGGFHGQRSLVVYSPGGCRESDTTLPLHRGENTMKSYVTLGEIFVFSASFSIESTILRGWAGALCDLLIPGIPSTSHQPCGWMDWRKQKPKGLSSNLIPQEKTRETLFMSKTKYHLTPTSIGQIRNVSCQDPDENTPVHFIPCQHVI